jgi:hypothetical protein
MYGIGKVYMTSGTVSRKALLLKKTKICDSTLKMYRYGGG